MQNYPEGTLVSVRSSDIETIRQHPEDLAARSSELLKAYFDGDPAAVRSFVDYHPTAHKPDFEPALIDAKQVLLFQELGPQKLSLERLKKTAKQQLKALKAGDPAVTRWCHIYHPKLKSGARSIEEFTLADIQHVLARENGFHSWPRLKHHLNALENVQSLLKSGQTLDTEKILHLRCGDDIRDGLKLAGLNGGFKDIINPFTMGPVFPNLTDEDALTLRTEFMNNSVGRYIEPERREGMRQSLVDEENFVKSLPGDFEEITLWFEHDAYDQLCLAYLLHHFHEMKLLDKCALKLVQVDRFPGIKRFLGIGQIEPEGLALLFQQRLSVMPEMASFAYEMWEAFTADNPVRLFDLTQQNEAPLPLMQKAFSRLLMEFPSPKNGLGFTENMALEIISEEEELIALRSFLFAHAERDPQSYHGDIMFFSILQDMIDAEKPALKIVGKVDQKRAGAEILRLTLYGEELLAGRANWLHDNRVRRWVGGTEINGSFDRNWYYQGEELPPALI
ncbi:MAG: DUF1835 domain-containing protein [Sneathiellales bacterium]|nr:DUF1835 domain-containing protein [Sneathiellales bacterium]